MEYSEEALRNSFAAVKKEIEGIKSRNSLMDIKLKNSFANFKKDVNELRASIEKIKARREEPFEIDELNERLGKIESAVESIKNIKPGYSESKINYVIEDLKNSFSEDIKRVENKIPRDLSDLEEVRAGLNELDKEIKRDVQGFKKAIEDIKSRKKEPVEIDELNERLGKIESAVEDIKNDFSGNIEGLKKEVRKDFESDLKDIRSELEDIEEARERESNGLKKTISSFKLDSDIDSRLKKAVDSLMDDSDINGRLRKLEKQVSRPVVKEIIKEKPVIKEIIKERPAKKPKKEAAEEKRKKEKGVFSKMIDFFAEE